MATTKKAAAKAPAKAASKSPAKAAGKVPAKKDAAKELEDLFEDSLKDIYWAEKALTHLEETKGQVTRLEEIFASMGKKAQAKKCDAMEGLLKEGTGIMEETRPGPVRDAGIIAASQKVEHYEIATYGTLAAFAKVLGEKTALKHLLATLKVEKACDELLTSIADTALNSQAMK